ncbi:putative dehydrogenase [Dysgonomonadaceae bacterium PH5-43]|nr:putative dehydrogenase [Dysgonomonadaceae bacterium PH5-43]
MLYSANSPKRYAEQKSVLGLTCPPIDCVKIGIIGLGVRATRAIKRFMHIEGVEIKAICDVVPLNISQAQSIISQHNKPKADEYVGDDAWKLVCQRTDLHLIYICTDWKSHTPMSVYAMECDKHVAVEVPAATTVDECWQLVNTAERTQKHCMMLENCCYDAFELTTLNMVKQGLFGEIIHAEGAYIHDLRERILSNEFGMRRGGNWQTNYNAQHTGNPYPTHGFGPICQALNIHRGDKLKRLVSMSSKAIGMTLYAEETYGQNSPEANQKYKLGDMNTTLIYTEQGKTILIQHDISNPRPYSRIHLLSGTKGYTQKYPVKQFAFHPNPDYVLNEKEMRDLLEQYQHPFLTTYGKQANEICPDRPWDFIMDSRLIHCLRNGLPLDQDVYDAAEWSCLVELTEESVLGGNIPIEIPDFTTLESQGLRPLSRKACNP